MLTNQDKIVWILERGYSIKTVAKFCGVTEYHIYLIYRGTVNGGWIVNEALDRMISEIKQKEKTI